MGVINGLASDLSAIDAYIETCDRPISFQNIGPELIEHDAYGATFWLE